MFFLTRNAGHVDQTDATPIIPKTLSWVFGRDLGPIDFEHGIKVQRNLIMEYCIQFLGKCLVEDAVNETGNKTGEYLNCMVSTYLTIQFWYLGSLSLHLARLRWQHQVCLDLLTSALFDQGG